MKSVLVLGGAGFIGSHLAKRLLSDGAEVDVVDNMSVGCKQNLYPDDWRMRVRTENCAVDSWEIRGQYDEVYHLAGVAATPDFVARPLDAFYASVRPLEKLLPYCRKSGAKLLFMSSSEIYGSPQVIPTPESCWGQVDPIGIRSGYDEGKRAGEALCMAYFRQCGFRTAVARTFNTYGPYMASRGSRLVPSMVQSALQYGRITVNDPGTQTRTLLYVDDCVEALVRLMEVYPEGPVNIGGVETFTMQAVAEIVRERVAPSAQIIRGPHVEGEPLERRPDITKAREVLGWSPTVTFWDGLLSVASYWRRVNNGTQVSGRAGVV